MIGSIIYMLLDVGFNLLLWTGKTTVNGLSYVYYYIRGGNTQEDSGQMEMIQLSVKELDEIKMQMKNQTLLLEEFKSQITRLKED